MYSELGVGTTVMITLPTIEPIKKKDETETVSVEVISTDDSVDIMEIAERNTNEQ